MITFQKEIFTRNKDEFNTLFELHWIEIARHTDKIKLNIDYDTYQSLEDAGILHTFTARSDTKLIGYIVVMVAPNLHYRDWVMAVEDVLFIHPDYRRGGTFIDMLNFAEQDLKKRGVVNFYLHMKTAHNFSSVLVKQGYAEIERRFEKQL